jgi:hypothetical protein
MAYTDVIHTLYMPGTVVYMIHDARRHKMSIKEQAVFSLP